MRGRISPPAVATFKARQVDVVAHLKTALAQLALDTQQDPFPVLFPETPT